MNSKLWIIVLLCLLLLPCSADLFAFEELRRSDYKSLPIATTLSVAFGYLVGFAFSTTKTSTTDDIEIVESNAYEDIISYPVESTPEESLGEDLSGYGLNGTYEKSFLPIASFSGGVTLVSHRIEEKQYLIKFKSLSEMQIRKKSDLSKLIQ